MYGGALKSRAGSWAVAYDPHRRASGSASPPSRSWPPPSWPAGANPPKRCWPPHPCRPRRGRRADDRPGPPPRPDGTTVHGPASPAQPGSKRPSTAGQRHPAGRPDGVPALGGGDRRRRPVVPARLEPAGRDRPGRVRPRPGRRQPARPPRGRPPGDHRTAARRPPRHLAWSATPTRAASTATGASTVPSDRCSSCRRPGPRSPSTATTTAGATYRTSTTRRSGPPSTCAPTTTTSPPRPDSAGRAAALQPQPRRTSRPVLAIAHALRTSSRPAPDRTSPCAPSRFTGPLGSDQQRVTAVAMRPGHPSDEPSADPDPAARRPHGPVIADPIPPDRPDRPAPTPTPTRLPLRRPRRPPTPTRPATPTTRSERPGEPPVIPDPLPDRAGRPDTRPGRRRQRRMGRLRRRPVAGLVGRPGRRRPAHPVPRRRRSAYAVDDPTCSPSSTGWPVTRGRRPPTDAAPSTPAAGG